MDSNFALVIATAILAILTGYYAFQTKRQVDLISKQRRQSIMPALQVDDITLIRSHETHESLPVAVVYLSIKLRNIGAGPALDANIRASCVVEIIHGTSNHNEILNFRIWTPHIQDISFPHSQETIPITLRAVKVKRSLLDDEEDEVTKGTLKIRFSFSDQDGVSHRIIKYYSLPHDHCEWKIDNSPNTLFPFSEGYPKSLLRF